MVPTLETMQELRAHWTKGAPLSAEFDQAPIVEAIDAAMSAIRQVDAKRLTVGFLGGTGVGKSTLLNAIAGETISKSGERRPTTDRIVVHRHAEDPMPKGFEREDVSEQASTHTNELLRGVVLVDLPDVDGHRRAHRDRVHRVLPHLDVLIVVTSIDKYADRVLYDELNALPQAPRNLTFVVNQIDRVTDADREAIRMDFIAKLDTHAEVQVADGQLLEVSALRAIDPAHRAEQLHDLDALFEELGTDPERRRVLTANAVSRVNDLESRFESALPSGRIRDALDALSGRELEPRDVDFARRGALEQELEETLGPWLAETALRASGFPIGFLHFLVHRHWDRRRKRREPDPFATGLDAASSHFEEFVERPIRIARKRAEERAAALHPLEVSLPRPEWSSPIVGNDVEAWIESLRRRAPKLGWKFRQHLAPALIVAATAAGVIAPLVAEQSEASLVGRLRDAFVEFATRLDPTQWIIVGSAVALYYLLLYPYFLFVLDRRVTDEARNGADRLFSAWSATTKQDWTEPMRGAITDVESWWQELESLRTALRG